MATIKFRRGGGDPIANIPISGATIGEPFFNTSSNKFWIHNGTTAIWVGAEVVNGDLSENSPTKIPTQQAVKTYVDGAVTTAQGGAVTSVEGVTGVVDLIAGSGISITAGIHPNKGITLTNTGVLSFNGSTGSVVGVSSINGKTGSVSLYLDDLIDVNFEDPPELNQVLGWNGVDEWIPQYVVTSFNGSIGAVTGVSSFNGLTGAVQGVSAAIAGTGISVSNATGSVTISNTGVLSVNGQTGNVTVSAGGVTGISAGTGISISGTTGNVVITNNGVLSFNGSTGSVVGVSSVNGATGDVQGVASINGVTGAAFLFGGDGITVSSVGTDPNKGITLALRTSGVVAGTTGSNSVIPILTVDQYGRITSLSSASGISAATVASSITSSDADFSIALLLNGTNQSAVSKTNNGVMAINPAEKALKFPAGGTLEIGTSFLVVSDTDSSGTNPRPIIIENHGPFIVRPKTTGVVLGNIPTFSVSTTSVSITGGYLYLGTGGLIQFEGDTQNAYKTILSVLEPTDTRNIYLPNASGTVALTNTSVASIIAGTAISVNAATGDVTVTNIGVQSLAGTPDQITVSGSTGAVTLSLPSTVTVPGALNVTTNLTVTGNLTVNGTTTTVNSSTLSVDDPLIQLARGNSASDTLDIGFYGLYDVGGTDKYAGLFRDASDGKFRLFRDLTEPPNQTVNITGIGYAGATLVANLEGTATTATNVTTTEASGTYYLAMASAISSSTGIVLDTTVMGLTYSTSTGILTCTQVEAIVDGGAY